MHEAPSTSEEQKKHYLVNSKWDQMVFLLTIVVIDMEPSFIILKNLKN